MVTSGTPLIPAPVVHDSCQCVPPLISRHKIMLAPSSGPSAHLSTQAGSSTPHVHKQRKTPSRTGRQESHADASATQQLGKKRGVVENHPPTGEDGLGSASNAKMVSSRCVPS